MRGIISLLAATLFVIPATFLTGCRGKPVVEIEPQVLSKAGLQYYWKLDLDLGKGQSLARIRRDGETLYCLTADNQLYALDASTGLLKWRYRVGNADDTVFEPVNVDGVRISARPGGIEQVLNPSSVELLPPFDGVLINTLVRVALLDRATGEVRRDVPLKFPANTSVASDGKYVYVGAISGWYYSIDLNTTITKWWLAAEDVIQSPLECHVGRLYVADEKGNVYCNDIAQESKVWQQKLSGSVSAPFHVDDRGCFVASHDDRVYAFALADGAPLWDQPFVCQGPAMEATQVGQMSVFQYANRDKFHAINIVDGKQRWSLPDGRKVLAVMDGDVYVLSAGGALLVVDEMLGTTKSSLPLTGWELFDGNTTKDAIFVASRDGRLACIRKLSAGRLTPADLQMTP